MFSTAAAMQKLASKIAGVEGKKHQATIGDIREVLANLSDAIADDPATALVLWVNGIKRRMRRKKHVEAGRDKC